MNPEKLKYKQIEDYLKGNMTVAERESFEASMSKDAMLREEVQIHKFGFESLQMEYLKGVSQIIRERINEPTPTSKYWWIGGTALMLMMVAGLALWQSSDKKGIEKNTYTINNSPIAESPNESDPKKEEQNDRKETAQYLPSDKKNSTTVPIVDKGSSEYIIPEEKGIDASTLTIKKDTSFSGINKESKETNKQEKAKAIKDCSKEMPPAKVTITPSDYDEHSGEIRIDFKESKPWRVYLEGANDTYEYKSHFNNLEAGSYTLSVKDTQNCIYQIGKYVVPHSHCSHKRDYVFNISTDLEWKVPVNSEISYKVSILNKAGQEVYSKNLAPMEHAAWNGFNTSGAKTNIGLYKAIVTFSDNKTCIYNVVVAE